MLQDTSPLHFAYVNSKGTVFSGTIQTVFYYLQVQEDVYYWNLSKFALAMPKPRSSDLQAEREHCHFILELMVMVKYELGKYVLRRNMNLRREFE